MMRNNKPLPTTHNIKQLGFSGLRGFGSPATRFFELCAQFCLLGHLLEQPPPYVAYRKKGVRKDALGQSPSSFLAFLDPLCDRLDGREPFCQRTDGTIWTDLVDGGHFLFHAPKHHHKVAGPGFHFETCHRKRHQGKNIPCSVHHWNRLVLGKPWCIRIIVCAGGPDMAHPRQKNRENPKGMILCQPFIFFEDMVPYLSIR